MTVNEAYRCVSACANYLAKVDVSPRAAYDLRKAVQIIVRYEIQLRASAAGSTITRKKSKAARLNGLKGGRPRTKK